MLTRDIAQQTLTLAGKTYDWASLQKAPSPFTPKQADFYAELLTFLAEWFNDDDFISVQSSGSTGLPKTMRVEKQKMINSAVMTCQYLNLQRGDKALLCMSLSFIAGKMMVVRALVAGLDLYLATPSGRPLQDQTVDFDFVAMVPMQVYNALAQTPDASRLKNIKTLLIGGGAIDPALHQQLVTFPNAVYSSYGMAETLSHIALCAINRAISPVWYTPLAGVTVSLSDENTLIIDAPHVSTQRIFTHDIAEINDQGDFCILGRKDNVINSGGVKWQIEAIEAKLRPVIRGNFAVGAQPDAKFGEVIVLLAENRVDIEAITQVLSDYERPKQIYLIDKIPMTTSQKIQRAQIKSLLRHPERLIKQI